MFRRLSASLVLGLAVVAGSAGIVSAHECFIASRSDQGNVKAGTQSARWITISGAEIFGFAAEMTGGDQLTPDQLDWALDAAVAAGAPKTFTIFTGHTIAEGTPGMEAGHATDGKGVDHAFDGLIYLYVDIYQQALAH